MVISCGLCFFLLEKELILADKAYIGHYQFVCPIKSPNTEEELLYNGITNSTREKVEHFIGRLRIFECFTQKWRHNIQLHPIMFKVINMS